MSIGVSNVLVQAKRSASGVTSANNGLDADSSVAVLGQDVGEAGNPAVLLSIREIPLAGFHIRLKQSNSVASKALSFLGNTNDTFQAFSVLNDNAGSSAKSHFLFTNDASKELKVVLNSSGVAGGYASFSSIETTDNKIWIGRTNGKRWISMNGDFNIISVGDIDGDSGNSIYFNVASNANLATIQSGVNNLLSIDKANNSYKLGDASGAFNGTVLEVNDAVANRQVRITANSGLRITGYAAHFLRTGTTLTDGSGAAAGTLGNAPVAGNPTKWIAIDDNGTTRWIPTWPAV